MRGLRRALLIAFIGAFMLVGISTASSDARPFRTGFVDNAAFLNVTPEVRQDWLHKAREAGSRFIRINVYWDRVAPPAQAEGFIPEDPGSPGYDWELVDQTVSATVANGMTPILMAFLAPAWAEGPGRPDDVRPGTWKPDPVAFAAFGKALVSRYSGTYPDPANPGSNLPKVVFFQGWNEPNLSLYLNPQAKGGRIVSMGDYRRLQNRFYAAVKQVRPDVRVLAAGLAPIGRPKSVVPPLMFLRGLTCTERSGAVRPGCSNFVRADIWDAHPFTTGGPTHQAFGRDDVSLGDLPELRRALSHADRANRIRGVNRRTPLWVTEFSWDTSPPDPGGLPMPLAKRWTAEALFRMWNAGVNTLTWLSIRDARAPRPGESWGDLAQSGFYFHTDNPFEARAKPSLRAFRFPFVAFKRRNGVFVWGRTPMSTSGRVIIRVNRGGGWQRLRTMQANRAGIFHGTVRTNVRHGRVQALHQGEASVPFSLRRVPNRYVRPFGG